MLEENNEETEGNTGEESKDDSRDDSDNGRKKFQLKNKKGNIVFDKQTNQRRYLSPFEQYIAEQNELFKLNNNQMERMGHDEKSETLTTTAST